ncbi:MAG: hypothetical protein ACK4R9_06205 [Ignavibacterium sp.]
MGNDVSEDFTSAFEKIKDEVINFHYYWIIFKQFFATNQSRIEIINKTTPSVFLIIFELLKDYITLETSKLTDPAQSGPYKNLSLLYLHNYLKDKIEKTTFNELEKILNDLISASKIFRNRRNKLVSHLDLRTSLDESLKSSLSFFVKDVENVLKLLSNYINTIDFYLNNAETLFEQFIISDDDNVEDLLIRLAKSLAYDDLVKKGLIERKLWKEFGTV